MKPTITEKPPLLMVYAPSVGLAQVATNGGVFEVTIEIQGEHATVRMGLNPDIARTLADQLRFMATEADRFNAHNRIAQGLEKKAGA